MKNHNPTMRVLETLEFVKTGKGFSLTEISSGIAVPPSTLFPILQTLRNTRYLEYDATKQKYSLGIRAFEIGSAYIQSSEAYQNIVDIMQNVTHLTGETCHFGVLDGGDVLYLAKVDSPNPIRMYSAIGKRLPAYTTGIGKALLADITQAELQKLYPQGLKFMTSNTVTDFDTLLRELHNVRQTGVAYDKEESNEMICCVATPVRSQGKIVAALSVPIPIFRYTKEKEDKVKDVLLETTVHVGRLAQFMDL